MPPADNKILELNQYQESVKIPFIIYVDLKSLKEKIDWCKNDQEKSSTTTVGENIPSAFSMSRILSFRDTENKQDVYRGKDCTKKFCESLREHAMKIKISKYAINMQKIKNIAKLEIIAIIQAISEVLHIAYII